MNLEVSYLEILESQINIDGEYINFNQNRIIKSIFFNNNFYVVVESSEMYQRNVFRLDLINKKIMWQIQENSLKERDYKNPYLGLLWGLSNENYLVFGKSDSWKVAVNYKNGEILKDINLNNGNRPW